MLLMVPAIVAAASAAARNSSPAPDDDEPVLRQPRTLTQDEQLKLSHRLLASLIVACIFLVANVAFIYIFL